MSNDRRDERRVVITGLGVVAPNGHGKQEFENSLRTGASGIRKIDVLEELKFRCQVGGEPQEIDNKLSSYFTEEDLLAMNQAMIFGAIASIDAWRDGGLPIPERNSHEVWWDAGCVIGSGLSGIDTIASRLVPMVNDGKVKRMGSSIVEQTMASSISAKLSGLLALGNQVTSNSSACNTGTEAIHDGFLRIRDGLAEKMLVGGTEAASPYVWGGFDAMRVLNASSNSEPEKASRPMSATAGGFIPGSGAGVLLLESLKSAEERGARIYAELLSARVNCGGHRNGGSMTAPNSEAVIRCIESVVKDGKVHPQQIDAINGHLTATMADPLELQNWSRGLKLGPDEMPYIQSTKSLVGHCLGAAGSIEAVAAVLELEGGFFHGSMNCEDIHPELVPFSDRIIQQTIEKPIQIIAKASFGFGDVNGCLLFRKWK